VYLRSRFLVSRLVSGGTHKFMSDCICNDHTFSVGTRTGNRLIKHRKNRERQRLSVYRNGANKSKGSEVPTEHLPAQWLEHECAKQKLVHLKPAYLLLSMDESER
jgi:hypothetical protein